MILIGSGPLRSTPPAPGGSTTPASRFSPEFGEFITPPVGRPVRGPRTRSIEALHALVSTSRIQRAPCRGSSHPWVSLDHTAEMTMAIRMSSLSFLRAQQIFATRATPFSLRGRGRARSSRITYLWSDRLSRPKTTHPLTILAAAGKAHVRSTMDSPRGCTHVLSVPLFRKTRPRTAAHLSSTLPLTFVHREP